MPPPSLRTASPLGLNNDAYAPWSRGIFPDRAKQEKEIFNMKHHNDHLTVTSGPESNPAGAALGRAAATFHPHPVPLPGTDHVSHPLSAGRRRSYSTPKDNRDRLSIFAVPPSENIAAPRLLPPSAVA